MKPILALRAGAALLILASAAEAAEAQTSGITIATISSEPALETRLGVRDVADILLYAEISPAGGDNTLNLRGFSASGDTITQIAAYDNVATGALFSLGDFCIGDDEALIPFVNAFDISYAHWDFNTKLVTIATIADSTGVNNTTSDCVSVGGTQFILSKNFDTGEIDAYSSPSFSGFSLDFSYNPAAGTVADPFNDGIRDTHTAFDGGIASQYQLTSGGIRIASFDVTGSLLGDQALFDATPSLSDGLLGEADIVNWGSKLYGIVNEGDAIRGGVFVPGTGENGYRRLNDVVPGSVYDFQGVSIEAFTRDTGDKHLAYASNRVVLADYEFGGVSNFRVVLDNPLDDAGGPVDTAWLSGPQLLFLVAPAIIQSSPGTGSPVTAIAMIDPTAVATAPLEGTAPSSVPVPAVGPAALTSLMLLLALAAGLRLTRRPVDG